MNSSTHLFLLFTILLIFLSHVTSPTSTPKLYQVVCKDAAKDGVQRCLNLFEDNRQITLAKDYITLCKLFLEMAIDKSTKAQNYLKSLVNKYPLSKAIKECATNDYNELVYSFKSSLGELVEDPQTASYDAKVAGDGPDTCQRALASEKIDISSSISTLNNEMQFLSFVAFLAANHLPE
ncbi:uncharacterized protein [Cicer arietinum]|uniref:Uncharacterized protein LOC101492231 n=1 Tax=Cicer arietinum TaxID=3827 RepID=A0A1S2YHI5_CICAR|nr:uncharacterized protein LOC101492231 [Cicer arietinum]